MTSPGPFTGESDVIGRGTANAVSPLDTGSVFGSFATSTRTLPNGATAETITFRSQREYALAQVLIGGELFDVERGNGCVYVKHRKWSLMGFGATLFDAEIDLRNEARELASVMMNMGNEPLAYEAARLKDFVFNL